MSKEVDFSYPVIALAPMAGVSDVPFRQMAHNWGADYSVGEMLLGRVSEWGRLKSQSRLSLLPQGINAIQLLGVETEPLVQAAQTLEEIGVDIIDLNFGCPAKKVVKKAAGSALMAQPDQLVRLAEAVVQAVKVPVSCKLRLGPDPHNENILPIALALESIGVAFIAVHGRTRAEAYQGQARYEKIAQVVSQVNIPVLANGDIDSSTKALAVLKETGAAGIMLGRSAWAQPWLFRQIQDRLKFGEEKPISWQNKWQSILSHYGKMIEFYPELQAVRLARKYITAYSTHLPEGTRLRQVFNQQKTLQAQQKVLSDYGEKLDQIQYS